MELLALASVALLLALATRRGSSSQGGGGGASPGYPSSSLSDVRRRALTIIATMVPSAYPDARFMRLVGASFDPATSVGTTCGALPGRVGALLGHPTAITRYGVPGVETEGRAMGAWVEAGGGRLPRPGDIYLLRFPPGHPMAGMIAHTGFVTAVEGDIWTTADAGQGTKEAPTAALVRRRYDPATHTLTRLDNGEARLVVGWIDLDRVPFPTRKALIETQAPAVYAWPHDPGER